jgi:hypothetical protein
MFDRFADGTGLLASFGETKSFGGSVPMFLSKGGEEPPDGVSLMRLDG